MDEADVVKHLKAAIAAEGLTKWARKHGIPHAIVSEVRSGVRRPTPQVIEALGMGRRITVTYYRKKGVG
jgi:hypothetical protein